VSPAPALLTGPALADDLATVALVLARRFAAGATMWCVSPRWPSHGGHLAVEFVHPVIVGKRALPAVNVSTDVVATVRLLARPGDIVAALGIAGDNAVGDVLRRCEPWGLTSVWLGAGPRPPAGAADHVLWIDAAEATAAAMTMRSGEIVLLYHLLWELTHVVFEHPGLLHAESRCGDDVCITCADEGRVAEIASMVGGRRAEVLSNGNRETIDASLVGPVVPGDLVLVHAGVALTSLSGCLP
jgi:hydrogenase maturation factor